MLPALRRLARPEWKPRIFARPSLQETRSWVSNVATTPNSTYLDGHSATTEFDGDAAEFVPKEVSVHDREQSQLTSTQKDAARLNDYNGPRRRTEFSPGQEETGAASVPPFFEAFDPIKHAQTEAEMDEAIEVVENGRDQ